MAITQTYCTSFKVELLQGVHDFRTDVIKVALYDNTATLGADTTVYTAVGEVVGVNYTSGGNTATVSVAPTSDAGVAYLSFDDVSWFDSTITARGALIYNSTQGNKAIGVLDFGSDKTSTAGTFSILFPTASATEAIIRLS